jgi:CubicO group peptidase (beta-lactamase class C family)
LKAIVGGTCPPEMELVHRAFELNFEEGLEVGASFALFIAGEAVVDLWGGFVDEAEETPWAEHTITNCWSTSKLITTLCILHLSDSCDVGLNTPVSRYWPEFGYAGKKGIEIRHVLAHTSGVAGWDARIRVTDLYDWAKVTSLLEDQSPWWIPGTISGYHAFTGAFILGEVIRRVTGITIGEYFQREIAEPLRVDFHIGLPAEHDARVSPVLWPRIRNVDPDSWAPTFAFASRANPILTGAEPWDDRWRRAEIPAANGQGNARSLALANSVLACRGSLHGRSFFSPATAERVLEQQSSGRDLVLNTPLRWGIGYALPDQDAPVWPGTRCCYWGGWGGSLVVVDMDRQVSFAYMMNRMEDKGQPGEDPRARRLVVAAQACLEGLR